jgi:thiol:disulfide interchange protein DsbC
MSRILPFALSAIAAASIAAGALMATNVRAQAKEAEAVKETAKAATSTAAAPLDQSDAGKVKSELVKKFPELRDAQLRRVAYGGLYEIVINGSEIFYTDDKVSYLLLGGIVDANSRENITDARVKQLTAIRWEDLPLNDAVKIVRGTGARKMAVFSDPFCGYCKRLENDLLNIKDVTIYTFLLPIISPNSRPVSEQVWCSKDRGEAWLNLMLKGQQPAAVAKCDTPIEKNLAFGSKYKITGTPIMIFENGERAPGALPAAQIESELLKASVKKS